MSQHCQYAIDSPNSGVYFCRHPNVNSSFNIVRDKICQICTQKDKEPCCELRSFKEWAPDLTQAAQHTYEKYVEKKQNPVPAPSSSCCGNSVSQADISHQEPSLGELGNKPPSLLERSLSFGRALVDHAMTGFEMADSGLLQERTDICVPCDRNSTPGEVKDDSVCNECGCFLKVKLGWKSSSCPINKW